VPIYKKGQGKYTRVVTAISAVALAVIAAMALSSFLKAYVGSPIIQFGIPAAMVVAVGLFVLWMVNRPKSADFLIATEGEMKKVSWSNKKEIVGSTKVVIVTTLILAVVLFVVDLVFVFLFQRLGVL